MIVGARAFDFSNGVEKERKRENDDEETANVKGSLNRFFALNRSVRYLLREPKDTQRANSIVTAIRASSRAPARERVVHPRAA